MDPWIFPRATDLGGRVQKISPELPKVRDVTVQAAWRPRVDHAVRKDMRGLVDTAFHENAHIRVAFLGESLRLLKAIGLSRARWMHWREEGIDGVDDA
jgi:hypothetical protein